jgi:hypothetical protein
MFKDPSTTCMVCKAAYLAHRALPRSAQYSRMHSCFSQTGSPSSAYRTRPITIDGCTSSRSILVGKMQRCMQSSRAHAVYQGSSTRPSHRSTPLLTTWTLKDRSRTHADWRVRQKLSLGMLIRVTVLLNLPLSTATIHETTVISPTITLPTRPHHYPRCTSAPSTPSSTSRSSTPLSASTPWDS